VVVVVLVLVVVAPAGESILQSFLLCPSRCLSTMVPHINTFPHTITTSPSPSTTIPTLPFLTPTSTYRHHLHRRHHLSSLCQYRPRPRRSKPLPLQRLLLRHNPNMCRTLKPRRMLKLRRMLNLCRESKLCCKGHASYHQYAIGFLPVFNALISETDVV